MKSWRFHEFGSIGNLRLDEIPTPQPAPGEALVRLEYAALNPADRFLVEGRYPRPGTPPFAPGRDGCGVIETPAPNGRFKKGDRVVVLLGDLGVSRDGTFAEYVAVPESTLAPLPDHWNAREGAAAPLVFLTAWQALMTEGRLNRGQTVLVTGASGGVGTAAVILASALGARVVALSRSPEKRARLKELGADFVFDSADPDLVPHVREALGGGRADIIVENLAGPFLRTMIDLAAPHACVSIIGLLAGVTSEIDIPAMLFKRLRLVGIFVYDFSADETRENWTFIVEALRNAQGCPLVDRVFPFSELPAAFDHLASGPMGKVLIEIPK